MAIEKGARVIEMTITCISIHDAQQKIVLTVEDGYQDSDGGFVSTRRHGYITLTGQDFDALSAGAPDGAATRRDDIKAALYALLLGRGFLDAQGSIRYRSTDELEGGL